MDNPAQTEIPSRIPSFLVKKRKIIAAVAFFSFLFLAFLFFFLSQKTKSPSKTAALSDTVTISGSFDINGVIPPGSTIVVAERKVGDAQFTVVTSDLTPEDGNVWSWHGAQVGTAYELQAYLKNNEKTIARSNTSVIAAPAREEILTINSSTSPPAPTSAEKTNGSFATIIALPSPTSASAAEPTPTIAIPTATSISGQINLNGFVPSGSTISIGERKAGETQFNIVSSGIAAVDQAVWSWNNAVAGLSYEIQANVIYNNSTITQSNTILVAAPAVKELLTINSPVTPLTAAVGVISGKIDLNGYVPNNSSIALKVRRAGTNVDFNTVTTVSAIDNITWSWNNAEVGVKYDILAYLQVNGSNYAQSQLLVVTAPAYNETLIINSQSLPPAPPANNITFNCVGKNSSNQWQVTLYYNNKNVIQNAKQYTIQLGTSPQDSSLLNTTTTPSNPNQMQSVTTGYVLSEGTTYWAKFAYSTCTNCNVFSPFSPDYQLSCTTPPPTTTPTITPVPTMTPVPTPTSIPTNTPVPTLTPTPTIPPLLPTPTDTIPPAPTNNDI